MRDFNLLPKESASSKEATKIHKALKRMAIASVVIFILASVVGGGTFLYFSNSLSTLKMEESNLKNNVENLQATEGRLVILKDRLSKIQNIVSQRQIEETFAKHKFIVEELPEGTSYKGTDLELASSTLTIGSDSSLSVKELEDILRAQTKFTSLTLLSLSYNPFTGYEMKFDVR